MTDLTTTHLQHLLDQATTGPWEAKDSDCITSEHGEVLWNADQAVDWSRNDHDVNLAAAAPELAGEVLRMRKGLQAIRSDLHETTLCDGTTTGPYLQGATAQAAATIKQIDQILGDHDE